MVTKLLNQNSRDSEKELNELRKYYHIITCALGPLVTDNYSSDSPQFK
jgi:hypothetical protein